MFIRGFATLSVVKGNHTKMTTLKRTVPLRLPFLEVHKTSLQVNSPTRSMYILQAVTHNSLIQHNGTKKELATRSPRYQSLARQIGNSCPNT